MFPYCGAKRHVEFYFYKLQFRISVFKNKRDKKRNQELKVNQTDITLSNASSNKQMYYIEELQEENTPKHGQYSPVCGGIAESLISFLFLNFVGFSIIKKCVIRVLKKMNTYTTYPQLVASISQTIKKSWAS